MTNLRLNCAGLAGVLAAMVVLVGCSSSQATRALSFGPVSTSVGSRVANASGDTLLDALNGGILPQEAVGKLSRPERQRALEAEYQVLEKTPLGQKVTWTSPGSGATGEVTAGTPYQVGQQNCRQYTHLAVIRGASVTGRGAACRNPDGSWTPLS